MTKRQQITSTVLRTMTAEILAQVEEGAAFIITIHGRQVATLDPAFGPRQPAGKVDVVRDGSAGQVRRPSPSIPPLDLPVYNPALPRTGSDK